MDPGTDPGTDPGMDPAAATEGSAAAAEAAPSARCSGAGGGNTRGFIPQEYRDEVVQLLKLGGPVVRLPVGPAL